jgi:4'-phosphopantetheinyl transferase
MPTTCELWYVKTAEIEDVPLVSREALMDAAERMQWRKFVFQQHRHEYLVTRALAQCVLARWTHLSPGKVAFRRTSHGRPVLHPPSDIRFSLTNTVVLVACLVGAGRELGVDAEPSARADQILAIADSFFTATERAALGLLDLPQRRRRAVELWTCKEAYMKARGMGMALPPQNFSIDYESGAPRLDLSQLGDDDGERWQLRASEIEGHVVSTCVERGNGEDFTIETRHADLDALIAASGQSRRGGA